MHDILNSWVTKFIWKYIFSSPLLILIFNIYLDHIHIAYLLYSWIYRTITFKNFQFHDLELLFSEAAPS